MYDSRVVIVHQKRTKLKCRAYKTHSADEIATYKLLKNSLQTDLLLKKLVKQSKSDPHLSSQLRNSINNVIGRRKTCDSGISKAVSPDSLYDFFCNDAVSELLTSLKVHLHHHLLSLSNFPQFPLILFIVFFNTLMFTNPQDLMVSQHIS